MICNFAGLRDSESSICSVDGELGCSRAQVETDKVWKKSSYGGQYE